MALIDTVQATYSTTFLKQLTNPDSPGVAVVNTTLLAQAILFVKAEFLDRTGVALDDTTPNQSHLALGCRGVILALHEFRGLPLEEATKERDAWYAQLYAYAKTQGLNWIPPTTNSGLQPSLDSDAGQTVRPLFDNAQFRDMLPRDSTSSGSDPDQGRP